jgi:glycosyltransferase involved in cell wall biosynthesis
LSDIVLSVVIPHFNRWENLKKILSDYRGTSYNAKIELIILDDCSTEAPYAGFDNDITIPNVQMYLSADNLGPQAHRNRGLEIARGRYVMFLDSDDRFDFQRFFMLIDSLGVHENDALVFNSGRCAHAHYSIAELFSLNKVGPISGVVFPRESISKLRFDESLVAGTDWDFYMSVADAGLGFRFTGISLLRYEIGGVSITNNRNKSILGRLQLISKYNPNTHMLISFVTAFALFTIRRKRLFWFMEFIYRLPATKKLQCLLGIYFVPLAILRIVLYKSNKSSNRKVGAADI